MFKELSDLPKTIEAFVGGLIAFVYRFIATVVGVFTSPFSGALRANSRPAASSISPPVMLFLACALVAIVAVVTPNELGGVLTKNLALVGQWLFYTLVLFFLFDVPVLATSTLLHKRGRRRRRMRGLLRLAIAGMTTAWFVSAAVTVYGPGSQYGLAPHWSPSPLLRRLIQVWRGTPLSDLVPIIPLAGTAWLLFRATWSSGPLSTGRAGIILAVLIATEAGVGYLRLPELLESTARTASAKLAYPSTEPPAFPALPQGIGTTANTTLEPPNKEVPVSPVRPSGLPDNHATCRVEKNGHITVTAVLRNSSPDAQVINTGHLQVSFQQPDSNLLDPKFLHFEATSRQSPLLVATPHGAVIIVASARIPDLALIDLSRGCYLSDTARQNGQPSFPDIMGPVEAK